jgi:hypothetical protein
VLCSFFSAHPATRSWIIVLGVSLCMVTPVLSWIARLHGYGIVAPSTIARLEISPSRSLEIPDHVATRDDVPQEESSPFADDSVEWPQGNPTDHHVRSGHQVTTAAHRFASTRGECGDRTDCTLGGSSHFPSDQIRFKPVPSRADSLPHAGLPGRDNSAGLSQRIARIGARPCSPRLLQ